ncbi:MULTISPECIES: Ig-like domain-containing protein [unclassified Pseudomonas]|uniref:Ig-like domain-containing protein n=1 Tax=unclassified Pseudomonas TaxID=196821 RepID=UPI0011A19D64|nr:MULTISPECIES: Ig-like domain-containing protein [unclassified Pseudomonas]TWC13676.1 Ig-like protein group 2 [Pseudomonas sp. SJZ075]TWC29933.1 Ig-like protein group 2 [Pseudomonas sp. SJZ078]TWC50914.1 Ig-like protein group 2 [Pseudomonas sp. SJZ124]TWC86261.1 Ig-like protein group 2 [Pseudomonas sp. SJZ101]
MLLSITVKKILPIAFGIALLLGCSATSQHLQQLHANDADEIGRVTAINLTARYHKKVFDCGSNLPAYLCSGVVFRGTKPSTSYYFWNPSHFSVASGGVSFSYLREDSKFTKLVYGYNNGFIFRPYQDSGQTAVQPEVLCSFPVDAWTFDRDDKGCGQYYTYPDISRECQSQGITTATQWLAHFQSVESTQRPPHQCGFNVRASLGTAAARAFHTSLEARTLGSSDPVLGPIQNELRLATWEQNAGRDLPIEALFYTSGGLPGAQQYQRDFYAETDRWLPIIILTLPTTTTGDARFGYRSADQAFFPGGPLSIDRTPLALDGFRIFASWPATGVEAPGNTAIRRAVGGTPPYRYTSSNTQVATVSGNGQVTGIRRGSAVITVSDSSTPVQSATYTAQVSNTWLLGVVVPGTFTSLAAFHQWLGTVGGYLINSSGQFQTLENLYARPFPLPRGRYWLGEHGGVCPAGYYTYYHAENSQALACALPGESSVTGALYAVPY